MGIVPNMLVALLGCILWFYVPRMGTWWEKRFLFLGGLVFLVLAALIFFQVIR